MFCSLLMDKSDPGSSIEHVGDLVKDVVFLQAFSEGLNTIPETAVWEAQSTFFVPSPELSFLKFCLSFKRVGKHKVLIRPNLLHWIYSLTAWIRFSGNVRWKMS